MPIASSLLVTARVTEDSTVFWRGVLIVASLLLVIAVWALLRRRWAPRSLDAWEGKGVHPGLDALRAGLLVRVSPSRLVAIALEPLLADGRAVIGSVDPLRVEWPDRKPGGPVEEALSAAIGPDGMMAEGAVFEFLEVLYRNVNTVMAPYSGRETAVHYRRGVADLWTRARRGDEIPRADRAWLLLADPEAVVRRIPSTPAGELLHDVLRLAAVFETHLLDRRAVADRARAAKTGYFRHRRDLDLVRTSRGVRLERDRTEPEPESPFQQKLLSLASSLQGEVSIVETGLPLLLHYARVHPMVRGRHRGRTATVVMGPDGEIEADLTCSAARDFRIAPAGETPETFEIRENDGEVIASWMELPRMKELLTDLSPFLAIEGRPTRIVMRLAYDRDRWVTKDVLDRYSRLIALAEYIEERLVSSGAKGPGA